MQTNRPLAALLLLMTVFVTALTGCANSGRTLFDRHSLSRLYVPDDGDGLVFEATTNASYPADSAAAEAERMEWIDQWLAQRKICDAGFEVKDRIAIGSAADNPYRHDLRYQLRCAEPPVE